MMLIEYLPDDCLLHIFNLFDDPLNWVTIAQVCTRWDRLAQTMFSKITDIDLNDQLLCYKDNQSIGRKMIPVNVLTLKSVLQYIGQYVKSVHLGTCRKNTIFLNHRYGYCIDKIHIKQWILMLSQTCTNIVELKIGNPTIVSMNISQHLLSNKSLKKVTLPDMDLKMSWNCTFDSVEEVTLKVIGKSNFKNFDLLFPNMKKLILNFRSPTEKIEALMCSILHRVKRVKSLTIVTHNHYLAQYYFRVLSDISALSQLEELLLWKSGGWYDRYAELDVSSVFNLIKGCPNLRVIKIDKIGLGKADVSCFLTLPKLEQLFITRARFFSAESLSKVESNQFEHLTRLHIKFEMGEILDCSGFCDAIAKMPALKYLIVFGLPEKEATEFTCKVIANRVSDKDIIVVPNASTTYEPFRVYKTGNQQPRPEPLRLWFEPQEKNYGDNVNKFVLSLKNCSVIVDDNNVGDLNETSFDEYVNFFDLCSCSKNFDATMMLPSNLVLH